MCMPIHGQASQSLRNAAVRLQEQCVGKARHDQEQLPLPFTYSLTEVGLNTTSQACTIPSPTVK